MKTGVSLVSGMHKEALSNYQLDFDENLEKEFNISVLDSLTAVKAGLDVGFIPIN